MAGSYLTVFIGETYVFTSNVTLDGAAANLLGSTIRFVAKVHPEDNTDTQAIINAEGVVSGANNNVVTVTLTASDTAAYEPHPLLYWSLACRTSENAVYALDRGRMAIEYPVVRSP